MKLSKMKKVALLVTGIFLISFFIALTWGSYDMSIVDVFKTLLGQGDPLQNFSVFELRLPRIILACIVASALSVAGALLQNMSKNDLADAGIIGINAGASFAAVVFISLQSSVYYESLNNMGVYTLPLVALCGGLSAAIFIYMIAFSKGMHPQRLLLSGIGINIALNALILLFTFKSGGEDYNRVLIWTSGSLWGSSYSFIIAVLPIILPVLGMVFYAHKTLDVMALDDTLATGLGVNVRKQQKRFLLYAVLLASCATAVAGNISFIGIIGVHIAKRLVGFKHSHFLPITIGVSASLMILADAIGRNAFSPIEIPVGIMISLIGVPYFIFLIVKEKR